MSDLVVGFDLDTGEVVHVLDRPMEQWASKGHNGDRSLVCFCCYRGDGAPAGTRVGLVPRGRVDGQRCFHFAHPPGQAPAGGHGEETQWHLNAKLTIARWAQAQPGVVEVRQERWIDDGRRRADVHVRFAGGQRVVVEVQGCHITDTEWLQRHRDYRAAEIVDVWLWRGWSMMSKRTLVDGVSPWVFSPDKRTVRLPIAGGHRRVGRWWETEEPHLYGSHFPPCVGDTLTWENQSLEKFALTPDGLQPPIDVARRLADSENLVRAHAAHTPKTRAPVPAGRPRFGNVTDEETPTQSHQSGPPLLSDEWFADQRAYWRSTQTQPRNSR